MDAAFASPSTRLRPQCRPADVAECGCCCPAARHDRLLAMLPGIILRAEARRHGTRPDLVSTKEGQPLSCRNVAQNKGLFRSVSAEDKAEFRRCCGTPTRGAEISIP